MPEENKEKLKKILELLNDKRVSEETFGIEIKRILEGIKWLREQLESKLAQNKTLSDTDVSYLDDRISTLENTINKSLSEITKKQAVDNSNIKQYILEEVNNLRDEIPKEADFSEIEQKLYDLEKKIPTLPTDTELISKINPFFESFKNQLEEIKKEIEDFKKQPRTFFGGSVQRYKQLQAGSGITITENKLGFPIISSTGGGTLTELTATGTIDGVNKDFTFTEKPTYIYNANAKYRENKGWTWNAGTLTATLDIPPSLGSDVWGEK